MCIPTGVKSSWLDLVWITTGRSKFLGLLEKDWWRFISGQTVLSFPHIEPITLGAGKEVGEVTGGANGMGVDRIG